ncbi:MAG: molybdopterin molybdotransferase MoeA [Elusimicrobia bacterium]|nr:molybdopterin molybdotransferase MoeA [Elusimicrobiota bacterium]
MISVKKALSSVLNNFNWEKAKEMPLLDSLGHVLGKDIFAPDKLPRFDNSAMDGCVIRSQDTKRGKRVLLKIVSSIFSGDDINGLLIKRRETAQIATGAPIPKGTNAVVAMENANVKDGFIEIDKKISKGTNIRKAGEDVKVGKIVARHGDLITPGLIGFLSSLGITSVKVFAPPEVGLIATGSELACAYGRIGKFQIRDSNTSSLVALLKSAGINPVFVKRFPDKKNTLCKFLKNLKTHSNIIILAGGVSVGEHDYVKQELEKFGVKRLFWKVSQKPGKPLYAAIRNGTIFFGLPGNPAAVITCFYLYVLPVINKCMHKLSIHLPKTFAILENDVKTDECRTVFLRARYKNGRVKLLKGQGSHMLLSFSKANSLFMANPGKHYKKGKKVQIFLL